jgi:hypothetical protein
LYAAELRLRVGVYQPVRARRVVSADGSLLMITRSPVDVVLTELSCSRSKLSDHDRTLSGTTTVDVVVQRAGQTARMVRVEGRAPSYFLDKLF